VTESVALPPFIKQAVFMPDSRNLELREWLVPAVLVPMFWGC